MKRALVAVTASAGLLALTGCTGGAQADPREPAAVALAADKVDALTIGLVVSSTSDAGQGSEWLEASAGAEVAAYRFGLAGRKITFSVVDDRGSAERATQGVQKLVDEGVSGIVLATSGSHVEAALDLASDADVPVVAPYLRTGGVPEGVHVLGPSEGQVDERLTQARESDGVSASVVLVGDGSPAPDLEGARTVQLDGDNLKQAVRGIAKGVEDRTVDSVVVSASTTTQARAVAALQGAAPDLPVYLTPEALSPRFADAVVRGDGTVAGRLEAVGVDASDASTLGSDAAADSAAAYFSALRLLASDPDATSVVDGTPLQEAAADADLPSHDAVVALVRAASKAGSSKPGDVAQALDGLKLGAKQALAGPALDFSSTYVVPGRGVAVLRATTQDPGVRPEPADGDDAPRLFWFGVGDDAQD